MTDRRRTALVLAWLMVSSLAILAIGPLPATADTYTVDADHDLATDDAIATYADEEYVTGDTGTPNMQLTLTEASADVGLDGYSYTDYDTQYLRVEYHEDIERTVRFYMPGEFWHPFPDSGIDAEDADVTAEFDPVTHEGEAYTAVTVDFEERTDAVFAVPKQTSLVFAADDYRRDLVENMTGYELPGVDRGENEPWQYVPTSDLTQDGEMVAIEHEGELTMQYDDTPDADDPTWMALPSCSDSAGESAPVCAFGDRGEAGTVELYTQTDDPPDVRFKHEDDLLARLGAGWNDVTSVPSDILDDLRGFIDSVNPLVVTPEVTAWT